MLCLILRSCLDAHILISIHMCWNGSDKLSFVPIYSDEVDIHGSKQGLMVAISPSLTQSHIASILQHGNTSQATTDLIFSVL